MYCLESWFQVCTTNKRESSPLYLVRHLTKAYYFYVSICLMSSLWRLRWMLFWNSAWRSLEPRKEIPSDQTGWFSNMLVTLLMFCSENIPQMPVQKGISLRSLIPWTVSFSCVGLCRLFNAPRLRGHIWGGFPISELHGHFIFVLHYALFSLGSSERIEKKNKIGMKPNV